MKLPPSLARTLGAIGAMLVMVAGCAGWSTSPGLSVRIDTSVDRPLLIYVNGDWVGTIPERAGPTTVPASGHSGPPWHVEARTAGGTVLGVLDVLAGESATMDVRLRCGGLRMQAGAGAGDVPASDVPAGDVPASAGPDAAACD